MSKNALKKLQKKRAADAKKAEKKAAAEAKAAAEGPKKKSSITKGPFTVAKGVKLIWDQEEERWVKGNDDPGIHPEAWH